MIFVTSATLTAANGSYILKIVADTASDLPTGDTVQVGNAIYEISPGSTAIAADTGGDYLRSPSGSWILQPSQQTQIILPDVYSEAEVDALLTPIRTNVTNLQTQQGKNTPALTNLINTGSKNRLLIPATTRTHNGVTFTVNADGTVTANGTATANAYIILTTVPKTDKIFDGTYFLSGCPAGGVYQQSYALYAALSSYVKYDLGEGVMLTTPGQTGNVSFVAIVYSGYTADNLIFKPMVCKAADYQISSEYEPYCPTLQELYALVKSYHP